MLFVRVTILYLIIQVLLSSNAFTQHTDDSFKQVSPLENRIHGICKDITENGKTVDQLTEGDLADLPLGIARETPSGTFVVALDSAYSTEHGWFLSAYASVTLPNTSTPIAFAARNIAFGKGGLSASTQVRLMLVTTQPIIVNENLRLELPADGHNFIEFDCNGFKSINLKGNFIFSKGFVIPDQKRAPNKEEVTASFEINTSDMHNLLLAVNITPFKISGLDDVSFQITNAIADYSDIINPAGFILPSEYQHTYGADIQLWRGFFLQDVTVRLEGMKGDSTLSDNDLVIQARNLWIDDLGVSGWFKASNLISLQDGSANGWPLSIDELAVNLKFNKVNGGSMKGDLIVPLLGDEPLAYTAQMLQEKNTLNYRFSIATPSSKVFNTPFSAKIRVAEGSVIALEKRDGKLLPSALLHGDISSTNELVQFDSIKFENLGLTSERPYITSGTFSTISHSSKQKTAGFPVRIDSIKLHVFQGEAALGFAVALNLMNKEQKGFSAETYIQLLARMHETTVASGNDISIDSHKKQEWKFESVKVNDIKIETNTTAIELKGILRLFDNHPTYGNGFMGSLDFSINKIMKNPAKVTAYFGSKETYRYWHLDAYVPTKLPISPALTIHGMMGGASYHMIRQQPFTPDFNEIDPEKMAANASLTNEVAYLPEQKSGLSFLAGLTLVVGNENAINADVMLEVNFNEHGGMRYAQFNGSAFFFTAIKERGRVKGNDIPQAPVFASMNMLFDNDNNTFHANMKTYMNVAGVIRGVGPNNLVGEAVIHADPRDWYVYIGRPSQMFGVDIAKLAVAKTYFMIGTRVEDIPPPPDEVREVFNDIDEGLMRDENALARGRGFAAGAHLRVGINERLTPFYITLAVGAGTDVMLRDYGDAYCKGSSDKIGIDGWYASGQAYVFLRGKVGIRVRGSNFDIVSLGAAALLQAKLPNPTWMKGRLGGQYSILGGLVKGKFNLKFTVGEQCEIVTQGSELNNIQVIADIKPDANANDVNVFTAPQVSFNTSLDTDFTTMNSDDEVATYRVRMGEFTLQKENTNIETSIEWNAAKDVAILRTTEILPPQSVLTARVKIFWEKKNGNNWEPLKADNEIIYEMKETTFTTGTAPDFIPEENVAYSYPVKHQYNFHTKENGSGYIKLITGQAYLFGQPKDGTDWTYYARFSNSKGNTFEVPVTYNESKAEVNFNIPEYLSTQTVYKLHIIKRPASVGAIDQNLNRQEATVSSEDMETTIRSNTLEGMITQNTEKELYFSVFRTSNFETFSSKWASFSKTTDVFDIATGNIAVIGKRGLIDETFDEIELRGEDNGRAPLVNVIASPETPWMRDHIAPMLYKDYPIEKNITISWRDPEILGLKPIKAVQLSNQQGDYSLTPAHVNSGTAPVHSGGITFGYFLSWYSFNDYNDLRNEAARYLLNYSEAPQGVKNLLSEGSYTGLLRDNYPVEISYQLPDGKKTFTTQIVIQF